MGTNPEVFCTLVVFHVAALRPLDCHWARICQELQEVGRHHPDLSNQNNHHQSSTPLNDLKMSAVIHIEPVNLSWYCNSSINTCFFFAIAYTSGRFANLYVLIKFKAMVWKRMVYVGTWCAPTCAMPWAKCFTMARWHGIYMPPRTAGQGISMMISMDGWWRVGGTDGRQFHSFLWFLGSFERSLS